jgi:CDP-glycerol glycerophosphotransferase
VHEVAPYLADCLDSLLAQTWTALDIVIIDDGSTDGSSAIAAEYAGRDARIRIIRTPNQGLGAARNEGVSHARGTYLAFVDSDDILRLDAYERLIRTLERSGSDFVTGSFTMLTSGKVIEPPWMRRLHEEKRLGLRADDHPKLLGDVFAWNKVFRRSFWESAELSWPVSTRYEDQPTLTAAYLNGRFDCVPDIVYNWRVRSDGTSITQQRRLLKDVEDRHATKRVSWDLVRAHGSSKTQAIFLNQVLPGDLWRYFVEIPDCDDDWWDRLRAMVLDFWGEQTLANSSLTPVHRLTGWLVAEGRRAEASHVMSYMQAHGGPLERIDTPTGRQVTVPGLDSTSVDPTALLVRANEH